MGRKPPHGQTVNFRGAAPENLRFALLRCFLRFRFIRYSALCEARPKALPLESARSHLPVRSALFACHRHTAPPRPRGCPAFPSPLTFSAALGRLVPLGSRNAGPFTGTLAILRLRKFLRIFGGTARRKQAGNIRSGGNGGFAGFVRQPEARLPPRGSWHAALRRD